MLQHRLQLPGRLRVLPVQLLLGRIVGGGGARPQSRREETIRNLTILDANDGDVPLLLRFIRDLATYEKLEHEVVATEEGLRRTLFGEKRYAEALIARLDGEPVGFALFFHNYSTFVGKPGLYLEDLFVDPAHRGKGIGKALLRRLAEIAVERDCGRMEWAVLDWNQPSIGFYRALGAVPLDDWTVFRLSGPALEDLAR